MRECERERKSSDTDLRASFHLKQGTMLEAGLFVGSFVCSQSGEREAMWSIASRKCLECKNKESRHYLTEKFVSGPNHPHSLGQASASFL